MLALAVFFQALAGIRVVLVCDAVSVEDGVFRAAFGVYWFDKIGGIALVRRGGCCQMNLIRFCGLFGFLGFVLVGLRPLA